MWGRSAGVLALAAGAAVSGCGGGGSPNYAGLSRDEATQEAVNGAARERGAPDSPLYRRRIRLVRVYRGRNGVGGDAWVAVFREGGGGRVCVRLWATTALTVRTYHREWGGCPRRPESDAGGET